jgi:hypothetical protein
VKIARRTAAAPRDNFMSSRLCRNGGLRFRSFGCGLD